MKKLDKIKDVYKAQGIVTQKKAETLFIINMALSIAFVLFALLRIFSHDIIVGGAEIVVGSVLFMNTVLISRGRYMLASRISVVFFTMVACVLYAIQEKTEFNDIYLYATYITVVIIMAPFLCYSKLQFKGIIIAALSYSGLFWVDGNFDTANSFQ